MEETLEGGRGPPWAVAPLEEEEEFIELYNLNDFCDSSKIEV